MDFDHLQSNGIYDSINSLDWHLLPMRHRKIYQILLHRIQKPDMIHLIGIGRLNLETNVNVMNGMTNQFYQWTNLEFSCHISDIQNNLPIRNGIPIDAGVMDSIWKSIRKELKMMFGCQGNTQDRIMFEELKASRT